FWDNRSRPNEAKIRGNVDTMYIDIDDMMNGTELSENCTNCHRGENVFLLHPGTALAFGSESVSPVWYVPLGSPAFRNPPMFASRTPTLSDECTYCHAIANLGSSYCEFVMRGAADLAMPSAADPVGYDNPQGSHALSFLDIKDVCEGTSTSFCGDIDSDIDG